MLVLARIVILPFNIHLDDGFLAVCRFLVHIFDEVCLLTTHIKGHTGGKLSEPSADAHLDGCCED